MEIIKAQYDSVKKPSDIKPDVVVILSETYWDPVKLNGVKFNKDIDKNLRTYQNGTLISPKFGGGTANIEFELLTGLSCFFYDKSVIPYNVYFKRNTPGIVTAFKNSGYSAVAIHPNNASMYNRTNVYKYLGFDRFYSASSFNFSADRKGDHISDDRFIDKVIETLKQGKEPKFIFGISLQNHDPYDTTTKRYKNREIQADSDRLDNVEKDILSNFAQGVYDADKALGKLINEVKNTKKPAIVFYFGDHLPRLGLPRGIYDVYNKLGYIDKNKSPQNDIKFYETPLVIWSNYMKPDDIGVPVSPNQLSVEILKDAGIGYPGYFNYLLELRKKYPYLNSYLQDNKKLLGDPLVRDYSLIQYDIMFGGDYILGMP